MNKKLIRLTESDIHNIIQESINHVLCEAREVRNRKFRQLMKMEGLEDISLIQDNGYLWIDSDTDERVWHIPQTSIYVNSFNDMTPEEWVLEIKRLLNQSY